MSNLWWTSFSPGTYLWNPVTLFFFIYIWICTVCACKLLIPNQYADICWSGLYSGPFNFWAVWTHSTYSYEIWLNSCCSQNWRFVNGILVVNSLTKVQRYFSDQLVFIYPNTVPRFKFFLGHIFTLLICIYICLKLRFWINLVCLLLNYRTLWYCIWCWSW